MSNRQVACRTLAAGVTASARTALLQSNDTNTVANAFTEFLAEADWRCLAGEVHLNDGNEAPCRASWEKAARAFTAAADKLAETQRWAQEVDMRQAAAAAFTAAFTAAKQAGAAFVGGLLAEAADAQGLAEVAYAKTLPGGWSRPDRELSKICAKAALAAQQAAEAVSGRDTNKYLDLAVDAYTRVGQYTDVAKIHRQRANEHLSQFGYQKAALAFNSAAIAELKGRRPIEAAIDFRAGAGVFIMLKRFSEAAGMYAEAASAHSDARQYREAASAAEDAAAAYESDYKPYMIALSLETAAQALARVPDPLGAAALWERVAATYYYINGTRNSEARACKEAGSAYKKGGRLKLAIDAYLKAEKLYKELGDVEQVTEAQEAADVCRALMLDMAAFEKMAPNNDQLIVDINAKITAHQVALQSEDGLKVGGRTLRFDNLCCFLEGDKFVSGTRDEFVLLFCGNVGAFVTAKGAEQLIRRGSHHIERRDLEIGDMCRGEKLWELLSQVT
ncbi:hypothetical protein [Pandoraea sputorum]|uniref:hypothetical protein n=1 Tax=Pandoraea sputorum TaxID=93222 RepID=UPI00178145FC|nr:hypothetical protein [Pandoraea sputorum]